jgi:hypothetical protein
VYYADVIQQSGCLGFISGFSGHFKGLQFKRQGIRIVTLGLVGDAYVVKGRTFQVGFI